jgi:hypothetical protein
MQIRRQDGASARFVGTHCAVALRDSKFPMLSMLVALPSANDMPAMKSSMQRAMTGFMSTSFVKIHDPGN